MKRKMIVRTVYLIDLFLIIFMAIAIFNEYKSFKNKTLIDYASSLFENNFIKELGNNEIITYDGNYKYVVNNIGYDDINITKKLLENYKKNYSDKYNYYLDYEIFKAPDDIVSIVIYEIFEDKQTKEIYEYKSFYHYNSINHEFLKNTYIFKGDFAKKILELADNYINMKATTYHINIDKADIHFLLLSNHIRLYVDNLLPQSIIINIPYGEIREYLNINIDNQIVDNYNDMHEKRIVNGFTNVYEKANRNSKRIGILSDGDKVYVISQTDEFSKIIYQNRIAYVLSSSLVVIKEKNIYEDVDDIIYISKNDVGLYENDNDDSEVKLKLGFLDTLKRIGISDKWSKVIYNNNIYFIKNKYIYEKIDIVYELE